MLAHRAYVEVPLGIVIHVLWQEGILDVLPLHLRVEHRILDIRFHTLSLHVRVVLLIAIPGVRHNLLALLPVFFINALDSFCLNKRIEDEPEMLI